MRILFPLILFFFSTSNWAQSRHQNILQNIENKSEEYTAVAQKIWSFAELGYQEEKSSALLQQTLADQGFEIQAGVAEIPTAFIATYGSGSPVIAILGEYDALPGLSQQVAPYKISNGGRGGHACGHHLFGTASAAAAIALKDYLQKQGKQGTVKYYGCPAEEGGNSSCT